jgi:hypothetical protein
MVRAGLLTVVLALLVAACGGGGSSTPSGGTTRQQPRQDDDEVAAAIASSVGKQASCYVIGSVLYRGSRTGLFQCELNANGDVKCYVRPGRKSVNVDRLLARKEVYNSLQGSDISLLGCVTMPG